MKRIFIFLALITFSAAVNAGNQYWTCTGVLLAGKKMANPVEACNLMFPSYTSGGIIYSLWMVSQTSTTVVCGQKQCQEPPGTWCGGPYGGQQCNIQTCPAGQEVNKNTGEVQCVPACTPPQVRNPYTGNCQNPCPIEPEPPLDSSYEGSAVGTAEGYVCDAGCQDEYTEWFGTSKTGYDLITYTHKKNGQMCDSGTLEVPPVPPVPSCPPPKVVRADNTCGPPDPVCKSWETLENHQCVDKPCPVDGELLKCGTVNGEEFCACAGVQDCPPGQEKNAFGNCVTKQDCVAPQVQDKVTGQCVDPPNQDCPSGYHREGLMCVPDKEGEQCQSPEFYIPGCGCVTSANFASKCADRKYDIDGDGIPNNQDSDADGDGNPNTQDGDDDNDGTPDPVDPTPQGAGTSGPGKPGTGPGDDLDGDGVPNGQDGDDDGDGVPDGDDATPNGPGGGSGDGGEGGEGGECNPEVEQCGTGEPGAPAPVPGAFYESKGVTIDDVIRVFTASVQSAPIVHSGEQFFTVSGVSGSCPTWTIPATYISSAVTIELQCSSEVATALRVAGVIVLLVAAWIAVKIALIEG